MKHKFTLRAEWNRIGDYRSTEKAARGAVDSSSIGTIRVVLRETLLCARPGRTKRNGKRCSCTISSVETGSGKHGSGEKRKAVHIEGVDVSCKHARVYVQTEDTAVPTAEGRKAERKARAGVFRKSSKGVRQIVHSWRIDATFLRSFCPGTSNKGTRLERIEKQLPSFQQCLAFLAPDTREIAVTNWVFLTTTTTKSSFSPRSL